MPHHTTEDPVIALAETASYYYRQATLWIAVKALAYKVCCARRPQPNRPFIPFSACLSYDIAQHDCALVNVMRAVRDHEARASAKFRKMCKAASFGSSSADTNMSDAALALQDDYPEDMHETIDKDIYTRLLLCRYSSPDRCSLKPRIVFTLN